MDFSLNEEQRHWQSEARKFAADVLRPASVARDQIEGGFEPWDWEIIEAGSKLGFRTLAVPKEWGGPGADFIVPGDYYIAVISEGVNPPASIGNSDARGS